MGWKFGDEEVVLGRTPRAGVLAFRGSLSLFSCFVCIAKITPQGGWELESGHVGDPTVDQCGQGLRYHAGNDVVAFVNFLFNALQLTNKQVMNKIY